MVGRMLLIRFSSVYGVVCICSSQDFDFTILVRPIKNWEKKKKKNNAHVRTQPNKAWRARLIISIFPLFQPMATGLNFDFSTSFLFTLSCFYQNYNTCNQSCIWLTFHSKKLSFFFPPWFIEFSKVLPEKLSSDWMTKK